MNPWLFAFGGFAAALLFDLVITFVVRSYDLETTAERRALFVVVFALHGPFLTITMGLFLSGEAGRWLVEAGMKPELALLGGLLIAGLLAIAACRLAEQLPPVRRARALVLDKMIAQDRQRFAQTFGSSNREERS